ncbi:DUF433 domain-containing protein [Jiangella ureilytica]|uniref:DUF433 domain-containing protein n=2 Tax=Jiangella ureilytica TaxID=2530374 RepID=A0A4R4RK27_9ACTN|nr:DUF433 domain-containing protein [Jiangella ureilytica]
MAIDIYSTPLLTAREAARHLRMPESTLDNWLAASKSGDPLVHAVTPERRGWPRVPFVGVIEAYVLRALRDLGMPLADIRKAAEIVRAEFDDPYALASRRIATDGVAVFVRLADDSLVHARDSQGAFREVLDGCLRYIEWSSDGSAKRLRLPQYPSEADVVIDPRFGWGAPVLERNKVKVDDLVALWRAGESIKQVADEYDLTESAVEDVLRLAA